ncbi:glycosyltransferase family 2 protein [Mycoplasmopsis primatum]|uniref:glycosyltransferase family 2 protein n=1 Tax=Mycoplasmopsis primatum TaxID=55604 RepID=UPI00049623BA|nr:glycosyltransferase family 2 protein [Mycoplasmopsis primatum]
MNQKQPKISVLIPCHNIEKLSYFSLKSVLKNKYPNLEIVLLNDYSTDNTLDILHQYANKDPRIKVFDLKDYHEHVGIGFNRDFLIEKATGEYFLFIDDDDKIKPNAIQELADTLNDDYDIIAYKFKTSFQIWKNFRIILPTMPKFKKHNRNDPMEFYMNRTVYPWGQMIKKEYYLNIKEKYNSYFEGNFYEDAKFMNMLFLTKPKFYFLNKSLQYYQIRRNSSSSAIIDWQDKFNSLFDAYDIAIKNIINYGLMPSENDFRYTKLTYVIQMMMLLFWVVKLFKGSKKREFINFIKNRLLRFRKEHNIDVFQKTNLVGLSKYIYKSAIKIYTQEK